MTETLKRTSFLLLALGLSFSGILQADDGEVIRHQKISNLAGGLAENTREGGALGWSIASIGDLDGDGVQDFAVGAPYYDENYYLEKGSVWIFFMRTDGQIKRMQRIGSSCGGFRGHLDIFDDFGKSVTCIGDVDGDGVVDLAVGAPGDDDGMGWEDYNAGAVWILFLNRDGTVKSEQKISSTEGWLYAYLTYGTEFGTCVTGLGDLNGDKIPDLAVGAPHGSASPYPYPEFTGVVYILFLTREGTVTVTQAISNGVGGFPRPLVENNRFGSALAGIGDFDGDSVNDLVVGCRNDHDGLQGAGAIYLLFLKRDGTVRDLRKYSMTEGGLHLNLQEWDHYGISVGNLGDLDGNGVTDLAVGVRGGHTPPRSNGFVHVLFLEADATVMSTSLISAGMFGVTLNPAPFFACAISGPGDLNGDGIRDMAVGAWQHARDASEDECGTVFNLFMKPDGSVLRHQEIAVDKGGYIDRPISLGDRFGSSVATIGDLDGDGLDDLAVGLRGEDGGGQYRGAVRLLRLHEDGTVDPWLKIGDLSGWTGGPLDDNDRFGTSIASLGDLDGNGMADLAVGADGDDDGTNDSGAVWVLFLDTTGAVMGQQKISGTEGGFSGPLVVGNRFGSSVAGIGDLDGDGIQDLAVGATGDPDGAQWSTRGAVWILFMNNDGTVAGEQKISDLAGNFGGDLGELDHFGSSLAYLGDLDGDGLTELAVGAKLDDDGGLDFGAVWILSLNSDGTVNRYQKISTGNGGFSGTLLTQGNFGASAVRVGDINDDGVSDLAVGAPGREWFGSDDGTVWVLLLNEDGTVQVNREIGSAAGGFTGALDPRDQFGSSLAAPGDLDNDWIPDLVAGAMGDDDGGPTIRGALWTLFLEGTVRTISADLACVPDTGTIPFSIQMTMRVENLRLDQDRSAAYRIDATLPDGTVITGLQAGQYDLSAGQIRVENWSQSIPPSGALPGGYTFDLIAEDVTPAPFNQAPFPPSGCEAVHDCLVTGN